MIQFEWKNDYSVGDETIDSQHRKLFSLMRDFYFAMKEGNDRDHIKNVLDSLSKYCEMHFRDEEKLMSDIEYPNLTEHQQAHKGFEENITRLCEDYEKDGKVKTLELIVTVMEWIAEHIVIEDQKFKSFVINSKK